MKYLKQFESFTDYYTYQDIDAWYCDVLDKNGNETGWMVPMINPDEIQECEKRGWIKNGLSRIKQEDYILDTDLQEVEEFLEDFRYAKKHGLDIDIAKQSRKYNL